MLLLIDINLYSGQAPASTFNPWLLFNSFLGVIGGFITAWVMFNISQKNTKLKEQEKEREKIDQKLKYLKAIFKRIPSIFEDQERSLRLVVEELEKNLNVMPDYGVVNFQIVERFVDSKNHEDFRLAFIGLSKGEEQLLQEEKFDRLYEEIINRYYLFNSAVEAFDDAASTLNQLDREYQNKFEILYKTVKKLQTDEEIIKTHEKLLRKFVDIETAFRSPTNWEVPIKDFVKPLLTELPAEIRILPKFGVLYIEAMDVKLIYNSIIHRQEQNRDRLKRILSEIEKVNLSVIKIEADGYDFS